MAMAIILFLSTELASQFSRHCFEKLLNPFFNKIMIFSNVKNLTTHFIIDNLLRVMWFYEFLFVYSMILYIILLLFLNFSSY